MPAAALHTHALHTHALPPSWRQHRLLLWTLGVSVLIHAGLLTFRMAAPDAYQRVFEDSPLEVTLVNAESRQRPEKAQTLAQAHLAGGGDVPQVVLSTSPLSPHPREHDGEDMNAAQRQVQALKVQQMMLLSMLKQELATLEQQARQDQERGTHDQAREQRKRLLTKQLAIIEPRVQTLQGGPRKRYISPATQATPYALYYDKLRRTIELQGTLNFPVAGGRKLYGELVMAITVDKQGQLLKTEVAQSSGQRLLDERAVAIVRSTTPFEAFSKPMRQQADQLVVVSRFRFAQDNNLHTHILAPRPEPSP